MYEMVAHGLASKFNLYPKICPKTYIGGNGSISVVNN